MDFNIPELMYSFSPSSIIVSIL